MSKRKRSKDYDDIKRKIKKLEKKLRRRSRRHDSDESFSSIPESTRSLSDMQDKDETDVINLDDDMRPATGDIELTSLVADNQMNVAPPLVALNEDEQAQPGPSIVPITIETRPLDSELVPSSAMPDIAAPPAEIAVPVTQDLDRDLLDIIGIDPTSEKKDLAIRLEHYCTKGLTKELRIELKDKYLTPENCKLIDPPELNPEIKAAVSDQINKRDKCIESKQKELSLAVSCLGEAMTRMLSLKEKDTVLLKLLMDAAKIVCDCQHADSVTRRGFYLNSVKQEMKEQLQNTKIDKFLFSESLVETLKSAKAITKSGADLKPSARKVPLTSKKPTPSSSTSNSTRTLNWKNPGPTRRQPGPPRMALATSSTRTRPGGSSRPLPYPQQQQRPNRFRQ